MSKMKYVLMIILVLIMTALCVLGLAWDTTASAEDLKTVWVLCNPESYVNIRSRASKHAEVSGYACCGDAFETDGKTRNGFLHVIAPVEAGEGWISEGYIVRSEPEQVCEAWTVSSEGRVAARAKVNGRRIRWMHDGDVVWVYGIAEWAVTNRGFIRSEYLERGEP